LNASQINRPRLWQLVLKLYFQDVR